MHPFWSPFLAGLASSAAAWWWNFVPKFSDAAAASSFGGTVASISATMLGFMLAALAVLASINHTHLVSMMRRYGHYEDLLLTMFLGCLLFLACTLAGYLLLFGVQFGTIRLSCLIGLHVAALVSLLDVGRKLWMVLKNLRAE